MRAGDLASSAYPTAPPHASVASVEPALLAARHLVVEEGGVYQGLLTLPDVVERAHLLVVDCLTDKPAVDDDDTVEHALAVMDAAHAPFLPVFHERRFVGVLGYEALVAHLQREREQALRTYQEIFEASSEGILVIDVETGRIADSNRRAAAILGLDHEVLRGRALAELVEGPSPIDRTSAEAVEAATESGDRPLLELRMRRAGGEPFWAEVGLSTAELLGRRTVVATVRDISKRKRLEAHQARVEHLEALRAAAAGLAHDFANLSHIALSLIDLARRDRAMPARADSHLAAAEEAVERGQRLGAQLGQFARRGGLALEPTSLEAFVRENATFAARGSKLELGFSFPEGLPAVAVSKEDLGRAIVNLTLNAAQAAEGGPSELRIDAVTRAVPEGNDAGLRPGEYVAIRFADNGPGMAPEVLPRIFEPYFTTKRDGTGLGLALVSSIATDHGGAAEVDSSLGEGATFTLLLPVHQG